MAIRMRGRSIPGTITLAAILACPAAASQTIDDFDGWMQAIEARTQSVQQNIGQQKVKEATADARALQEAFALVEGFWTKRGDAADAVEWSKQAKSRATDLETALAAGNFDEASRRAVQVAATCTPCHRAYRPLPELDRRGSSP